MSDEKNHLDLALAGTYAEISSRIREFILLWEANSLKVKGRFFYLAFQNGKPTVDHFAKYIYWRIVPFCIPRKERERKLKLLKETGDDRYMHELTDKARNLFVSAKTSQKTAGEPGELILFVLLEAMLNAPQVACKMYLKTSEQVPVHGTDSVHISYDAANSQLTFIWGESKVYASLSGALDEICESIKTFRAAAGNRSPRDRDIDILKDHANIPDEKTKDALLEYFDPYSEKSNELKEVHACFVGFEYDKFDGLDGLGAGEVTAVFEKEYAKRIETACSLFEEKAKKHGLSDLEFLFFLIPFPSVDAFRKEFFKHLGVGNA